jgi:hypothetical protein
VALIVLHQVENGAADSMFVSLDDLLPRSTEGVSLATLHGRAEYGLDPSGLPLR